VPRLLIVEDDQRLAALMRDFLQSTGEFEVALESRGDRALERIVAEQPDLVVLDVMLPGMDGLSVCREVRQDYPGPILMLSALGDEVDQVVGLEVGADDYVPKPVSPRHLLARVRSLLRRTAPPRPEPVSDRIELEWLVIDATARTASVLGRPVQLTTAEFDLLWLLARHAGEPLDRDAIYQALRGIAWDGLDRSVDLRIVRLRRKLGDDGRQPRWIKSVRGVGYQLVPTDVPPEGTSP